MYHKLLARFAELKWSSQITIMSSYRSEVSLFRDKFKDTFGEDSKKFVDSNTVDGFLGIERDVAIFSCVRVRASKDKGIGYLADSRRMNVGIAKVRSSVGKRQALEGSHGVQRREMLFVRFQSSRLIFSVTQTLHPWRLRRMYQKYNKALGMILMSIWPLMFMSMTADNQDWGGGDEEGFDGAGDDD